MKTSIPTTFDVSRLEEVCATLAEVCGTLDMLAEEATPNFARKHFPIVPMSEYGRLIIWTRDIKGLVEVIARDAARIALVDADREEDHAVT